MIVFGPGVITVTPNNVVNPTPVNVGLAQSISYDESSTNKPLYGQNRRAIAMGAGTIKASGKIVAARFSAVALGAMLFGVFPTVGQTTTAVAEAKTIPAVTTFTLTVTNAVGVSDEGVMYASGVNAGVAFKRVASAPTIGQYSMVEATGVYTFAAADASAPVWITYNYTVAAASYSLAINNPLLGPTVTFGLNIAVYDPTNNKIGTWQINNAVISKFALATKLEDFAMPEYDYDAYANAAGAFGQWNFPDLA